MPIYEYTCLSCGDRFEHLFRRMVEDSDTHPCPECGGEGKKRVSATNFAFAHPQSQLRGAAPPNTGTSDDWNYDKAIGRDAEARWGKIHENRAKKAEIVRNEAKKGRGITMDHLVKERDGGYRVVEEGERKAINQHRQAAFDIANATKKKSDE